MITIEPHPDFLKTAELELAARRTLEHQGVYPPAQGMAEAGISIVLTDDEKLRNLNREYLGIDSPTDVLSFPASESDPDTGANYLGDILISIPRAKAQALEAGHALRDELQLLVVHGVLHLLGHDHAVARDKESMWQAQTDILDGLGLAGINISES